MGILQRILIVGALLFSNAILAQKTMVYDHLLADYKRALELYDKGKYGSAQKHFENTINAINDKESELRVNSEYYAALCALELFNKDAEHLLTQFVMNHPESPQVKIAYFQLGRYNYQKRKWEKVINWLDKVDIFDLTKEEVAEYHFKKGYSFFMMDSLPEAKKLLYEIKDVDTKYTTPARYYYAHIAYQDKEYQTALEGFLKLADDDHFAKVVPYYITQIYYLQEKYNELLAYAPALLDTATPKRVAEISRLVGDAYYRTNQFEQSIPYLERHMSTSYYPPVTDLYQLGYAYYKSKNYEKAIDMFSKISQEKNEIAQTAYYHLGDCYLKTDQKNFARNAFLEAYKMDFDEKIKEDALYNYALLSYELSYDPYNKSIDAFKEYIEKYPDSDKTEEAYGYLINVYMTTKNYKSAMESLESLPNLDPRLQGAYQRVAFNSAVEEYHNQKFAGAIAGFKKALNYPVDKELNTLCRYWIGESWYNLKNYQKAIEAYQKYIFEPGAILQKEFNLANYNMGYAYFNLDDYENSIKWFRKFASAKAETDTIKLTDANLRIADAYFLEKDYYKAEGFYKIAADLKGLDTDYAIYQQAIALGLLKKQDEKLALLEQLVVEYPQSTYMVDAKYQIGTGAMQKGNKDRALTVFNELIEEFPNSSYVKKSLANIGSIYYNNKENEKALAIFQRIVKDYPTYEDSKEALVYIQNIYVRLGEVEEYAQYMEGLYFVNVTNAELDSVMYEAAELQYFDGKYQSAKDLFGKYLTKFDAGMFALNANFYKGECEMRDGNYAQALSHYNYVIERPLSKFSETALVNAARINFTNLDFEEAVSDYITLEKVAEFKSNVNEAVIGQMKCFFFLKNYPYAMEYGRKVLSMDKLRDNNRVEAHIIIAKSALAEDSLDLAYLQFDTTASLTNGEFGAESKYYMALIEYQRDSLQKAETQIYDLVNRVPSYAYWVAKGLILLSDVYVKMNDEFQAKATLQSIIDNYEGDDDLKEVAQQKIEAILALEKIKNEVIEEDEMEIEFDDIDDSDIKKLYDEEDTDELEKNNEEDDE